MAYRWEDYDRNAVRQRYDHIAKFISFFDWLLFLPRDMRRKAASHIGLRRGDSVLDIGCGTGSNFSYLYGAVGSSGHIYGVDISSGMLRRAQDLCDSNRWDNIELIECDAADYTAPTPLDGILFSLSLNTMPHHWTVLRRAWQQLRPGGYLVIMDAKLPHGVGGKLILPFCLWLMKHTLLGNPLVHPWQELAAIADHFDMSECLFGSYYICRGMKPVATSISNRRWEENIEDVSVASSHRIAAE